MIEFRDAVESDLPDIVRLLADDVLGQTREQPAEVLLPSYQLAFQSMLAQGGRIILATEEGGIVGCLQFNIIHGVSHAGQCRAQIESVRVMRLRRGSGIGKRLLGFAIEEASRHKCGIVQLTSQRERRDAIRFYSTMGFVESHAGMKLTLPRPQSPSATADER